MQSDFATGDRSLGRAPRLPETTPLSPREERLYAALALDEVRGGRRFAAVVFHDAEDIVDAGGLGLLAVILTMTMIMITGLAITNADGSADGGSWFALGDRLALFND